MELKGKTMVITGGTSGLGLALAKLAVNKGAKVHVIGRDEAKLEEAEEQIGGKVTGHKADVRDCEVLSEIARKIGAVDVLVNNAGIWLEGMIQDNSVEEIDNLIDINFKGVIYATKAFLPSLLESPEADLINIASTSGLRGRESQSVYAASKFGVMGFTECLKLDLAETNIRVSGFYPGGMRTELFAKAGNQKNNQDWMSPEEVAQIIIFMIEQDENMVMDHVVINKRKTRASN